MTKPQTRDKIQVVAQFNHAGVAELADARDLKSRGCITRTGSIAVTGPTKKDPVSVSFFVVQLNPS